MMGGTVLDRFLMPRDVVEVNPINLPPPVVVSGLK